MCFDLISNIDGLSIKFLRVKRMMRRQYKISMIDSRILRYWSNCLSYLEIYIKYVSQLQFVIDTSLVIDDKQELLFELHTCSGMFGSNELFD